MISIKLNQTKRYLLYAALPIALLLASVKFQQIFSYYRIRGLQSKIVSNARRRLERKRKHRRFLAKRHIDTAASQYYEACRAKGREYAIGAMFAHAHLFDKIEEIGGIMKDIRTSKPILDKDTYTNMYLFKGPDENLTNSYCEVFSERIGIQSHIGRYHFFLRVISANGDPKRIRKMQQIHQSMIGDPSFMYRARDLIKDLVSEEVDMSLCHYYLRDKYNFVDMQYVKRTIRAETLVPDFILAGADAAGFDLRNMIEESNLGAWGIKMLALHAMDIEILINVDRFLIEFRRWMNTVRYFFTREELPPEQRTEGRITEPDFTKGIFTSIVNFIYKYVFRGPFSLIGLGWIIPEQLIDTNATNWTLGYVLVNAPYWIVAWPLFVFKTLLMLPLNLINKTFYMPFKSTPMRYGMYKKATNAGLKLLTHLAQLHRVAKKLDKASKKNPALRRLCKPYFDRIDRLLHDRSLTKYRYILRKFRRLSKEPITIWELVRPWDTRATDILSLVKLFDELPAEEEKAIIEALVAICMLDTFIAISLYAYEKSKKRKTRLPFVMGTLIGFPPLKQAVSKKRSKLPKAAKPTPPSQEKKKGAVPSKQAPKEQSTKPAAATSAKAGAEEKAKDSQPQKKATATKSTPDQSTKPTTATSAKADVKKAVKADQAKKQAPATKASKEPAPSQGKKKTLASKKQVTNKSATKASAPKLHLKGFYNLFVDARQVVKNDYNNIVDPKTSEQKTMVIHGFNGGGKSIYLVPGLGHNITLLHTIGFAFAEEASFSPVNYLVVSANIKDDASKGLSLMMAEAKVANQNMLRLIDGMDIDEKAVFLVDELFRGTPKGEGEKLLLMLIAYLQQAGNNFAVFSTHADLSRLAKGVGYDKLAFFTPGFSPKKNDFTYRIKPGLGEHPVCIHVLQKMKFHPEVLKGTINLLKQDANYRFGVKLRATTGGSWLGAFFGSPLLEKILMFLLILLIGLFGGTYLPIERKKKHS